MALTLLDPKITFAEREASVHGSGGGGGGGDRGGSGGGDKGGDKGGSGGNSNSNGNVKSIDGNADVPRVVRADGEVVDAYDIKRLQAYANSLVDYHMVMDLVPAVRMIFMISY